MPIMCNVSAQKWLYSENSYKAGKFDENQLSAWLSAVKNNDNLAFVKNLSSDNPLFKQTLGKVKELIVKGVDKNKITELHRLAINAQRLRILPVFQNRYFREYSKLSINLLPRWGSGIKFPRDCRKIRT